MFVTFTCRPEPPRRREVDDHRPAQVERKHNLAAQVQWPEILFARVNPGRREPSKMADSAHAPGWSGSSAASPGILH